jgi:hypothetical protein
MADQLQLRGGTTAETATFTGALREVTVDTDKDTLVVHDNALAGGYPLLRQDLSNLPAGTIDNADINASAAIVDTKLDTIATAGKVSNSATTATDANTASAIVARDASGNFTAGTITAALTGAASSNVLKAGDTMTGVLAVTAGTEALPGIAVSGDLNTGFWSPTADTLAASTAGSERLRITSAGSVGIGTTTVDYKLDVNGSAQIRTGELLYFQNAAANGRASIGCLGAGTNTDLSFSTAGSERARIDSSGRLGIGNTDPGALLTVGGSSANGTIHLRSGSSNVVQIYSVSPGGAYSEIDSQTEMLLRTEAGAMRFSTVNTERARIDSSGRLLVGTSTSSANAIAVFEASSDSNTGASIINLQRGQDHSSIGVGIVVGRIDFTDNSGNIFSRFEGAKDATSGSGDYPGRLVFSVTEDGSASPTERMRIASNGTSFFQSTENVIASLSDVGAGTATRLYYGAHSRSGTGGTIVYTVWTNGNVVNTNNSYGSISDIKLKENIVDANSQWDDLKALQVRNYNFKEGQTHTQIGLVAQEAELVSPGLVTESPDRDEDGNDLGTVTKSVNYSVLYMKAVKALQEAMERIETLEARLTAAGIE